MCINTLIIDIYLPKKQHVKCHRNFTYAERFDKFNKLQNLILLLSNFQTTYRSVLNFKF